MTYKQLNAYIDLHNHLCEVAQGKQKLNKATCKVLAKQCEPHGTIDQFILDFADANDCGGCKTWEEIVAELKTQIENGERF